MIELENVSKSFDNKIAIQNLSMQIEPGDIVGIVGANGAEKSTIMRLMAGVLIPDKGKILIDGKSAQKSMALREKIFFFPDEQYFFQGATIKETAQFYSIFYKSFDFNVFNRLCESFELDPKQKIVKLSKGMKRQVVMIIGIAIRPTYMILDEVFDGIDSVAKQTLEHAMERLVTEYGTTIITGSHNIREIEDICKRVCLIYKANMVLFKDVDTLIESYKDESNSMSLEQILLHEMEGLGYASKTVDFI